MSWISITSRSSFTANHRKHWFCFYASSICLEEFVYISWLGISATSYTCQSPEPFSRLLCCPHFSQVHHQLATDNLCKASVNLSAFAVLHSSFTTLLPKKYKLFLPTFYILGTADRLHFYSYSLFSFSEYFCLLQEHFCGLGQTSSGFSALPGNIHSISPSIHSNILKVDSADDFAFYFTENMISVRRKLYPPANNFTTYIPMYLYTLCLLLLQIIEQSYSYWGHYTYIFDLIQFLLLKDFCSCKYITSFLHHQNFPIKGLFPLPCKHNIIFSMQNKQHTHN